MKLVLCVMLVVHGAQLTYAQAESDLVTTNCGSVSQEQGEHALKLHPSANENLCSAYDSSLQADDSTGYVLSVELRADTEGMHVGVMYNIVDNDNFDFIFFSVETYEPATIGYVKEGAMVTHEDSGMWEDQKLGYWKEIHIRVSNGKAVLYVYGRRKYVGTITNMQFPMKASGGVIVLPSSGQQAGSLMFRDLQLQALPSPSESFVMSEVACGPSLSMKYGMIEVETSGREKCVIRPPVSTCDSPDYSIAVEVEVDEGSPGLAYNFIDDDNYDFMYFAESFTMDASICFYTGHVEGGREKSVQSGTCATSVGFWSPKKLEVFVSADSDVASFYVDDDLIGTRKMHYPKTARGGLLVTSNFHIKRARFENLFIRSSFISGGKL